MFWAVYGFLHSLLRAALTETNRHYPMDSWKRAFLQAFFGTLLLLPFIPLMHWPAEAYFYAAAAGVAVIYTIGMMIQLNLTESHHGRISSIYMPLEAFAALAIWVALRPWMVSRFYGDDLLMTLCVMTAFIVCSVGLLRIRPSDLGWQTFFLVAPVGLTYAVAGVITKIVMPTHAIFPDILAYALVNFAVMTIVLGAALIVKKRADKGLLGTPMLKSGLWIGFFSMTAYLTFAYSVVLAPNPGYTSVIAMLLPVWLFGWHTVRKRDDKANPVAAIFIVLGVLLLIAVSL